MNNIDIENLRKSISSYKFRATPYNTDSSANCTIGDLNRVIEKTAILLSQFVDELEKNI